MLVDGFDIVHVTRLLLHAFTPHAPAGANNWKGKLSVGVGRFQEDLCKVLAGVTKLFVGVGSCPQTSKEMLATSVHITLPPGDLGVVQSREDSKWLHNPYYPRVSKAERT